MRSSLLAFALGTALVLSGGLLVYLPLPFPERLMAACVAIFLTDAVGGRWFGYASLALLFLGLAQDPGGVWTTMLPLVLGGAFAALVVRHAAPGWLGVPLGVVAFALPLVVLLVIRSRQGLDFELPLAGRYPLLHLFAPGVSLLLARLVTIPRDAAGRVATPTPRRRRARG